jgi:hypothetical protein
MELVLLKIDSKEWEEIWNWLAEHPINEGIEEPKTASNEGQEWEYVGSLKQGDRVISSFRHRKHPYNNEVVNVSYSHEVNPESIQKTYRL